MAACPPSSRPALARRLAVGASPADCRMMRLLVPPPDMPVSRPDAPAGHGIAPAEGAPRHLLVWLGNHAHAESLARHAAAFAQAGGWTWTAVCVDIPDPGSDAAQRPTLALRALALAETLGAHTRTIHAAGAVDAVVECARRERATMVMVGGHAPHGWADGLPRHWLSGIAETLTTRLPGVLVDVVYLPESEPAQPPARAAPPGRRARLTGWVHAVAVVLLCTAVSETLLPHLEHASVAVIYLAGVVYVALRHGQAASMLAVVLSILLFDLLVVEPRWSLKPTDPQYYFTFIVMTIVGALVSRLSEQARQHAQVAEARARRAQALSQLAGQLLSAQTAADVAAGLATAVQETFGATCTLLLPRTDGTLDDPAGFCTPRELDAARALLAEGRPGEIAGEDGGSLLCLQLSGMAGPPGVLAVRYPAGQVAAPEERRLLDAFASQATLTVQRIWFAECSAAATVEAESERLRNTLLASVSHDFRTPLTSIIGSATSLLEQHDALDRRRRNGLLHNILDEARRMHAAMSDLLDLTRMEQGAVQPRCEWCPADDLVQEVREALGARLRERTLRLAVPPEAVVWCDPRLVQRALVNLLDNALRHTPAGSTIEVRIEAHESDWCLAVADDGPGLPAALRRDPFKKFAHGRGEAAAAGTGLGLAICAAVARLHDGRIEAADTAAGGTRFTLTLPQPQTPPVALEEAA